MNEWLRQLFNNFLCVLTNRLENSEFFALKWKQNTAEQIKETIKSILKVRYKFISSHLLNI